MIKPITVHFQQRPPSTHGPMIYRMTSVNPSTSLSFRELPRLNLRSVVDVPVFHVRAATASTSSTIKTDTKPISIASSTGMCYDPKQTPNPPNTAGSVSVLACFKTTKKRAKVYSSSTFSFNSQFSFDSGTSDYASSEYQ